MIVKLYRKLIRPMHSYPGPDYSPRVMPIEAEVKWYLEEEREQLENKYASYNEGSLSDLTFEVKFEPYICDNVIELWKEQEAVKPKSKVRHGANAQIQHFCGNCNTMLHGKPKFCSECGQAVKWE